MEISKAIRTGYFSALKGNITIGSNVVPVFDAYAIPEGVKYPYILLSSQTNIQVNLKRCKKYVSSVLVDIVTGAMDPIGRDQAEDIAEKVEDLIYPDTFIDLDISANGFQLVDTKKSDNYDLSLKNNEMYIFRKLIRFEHITVKL